MPPSSAALCSQVEHAVRRQMDNEVGPDQLVVVLDAQGASALQVTRKAQLCKDTAVTLNKVWLPFSPVPPGQVPLWPYFQLYQVYQKLMLKGPTALRVCRCSQSPAEDHNRS